VPKLVSTIRALSVIGVGLGALLTYNLLTPEPSKIGPLLVAGPASILGPLLLSFSLGGYLCAGRSARFLLRAGIMCCVAALLLGVAVADVLAVSPFLRFVVLSAFPIMFGIGVVMIVHAHDTRGGR
jgi:hypothetical protein